MIKYIVKDLTAAIAYLPYGIVAGIVVVLLLSLINDRRVRKGKPPFCVCAITALLMYMFIILCITFLSRESGSGNGTGIDMEFFSTWGINDRNNAYVVENILLFVPYGILFPWAFKDARNFLSSLMSGVAISLGIECMQLFTARGFFQIDDILTNTLGTVLGYLVFKVWDWICRKVKAGRET